MRQKYKIGIKEKGTLWRRLLKIENVPRLRSTLITDARQVTAKRGYRLTAMHWRCLDV